MLAAGSTLLDLFLSLIIKSYSVILSSTVHSDSTIKLLIKQKKNNAFITLRFTVQAFYDYNVYNEFIFIINI